MPCLIQLHICGPIAAHAVQVECCKGTDDHKTSSAYDACAHCYAHKVSNLQSNHSMYATNHSTLRKWP